MSYDPYDLAHIGKVIEVNGEEAVVDLRGIKRKVNISLVDAKVGDYVLVHAGYAIKVLNEKDIEEELKMILYNLKD
jgi:hydrogenase expression/formation protein HypC